jgi:hypothetical protein
VWLRGGFTSVLLSLALVVGITGVEVKVSPVCIIVLLFNIASVLLALALVVRVTGIEMKISPVSIVVLFLSGNVAAIVLLAFTLVVAGFKLTAVVLLALALVVRVTSLNIAASKSSNKV